MTTDNEARGKKDKLWPKAICRTEPKSVRKKRSRDDLPDGNLDAGLKKRILDRMLKIPAVKTFGLEVLELSRGTCSGRIPRQTKYDGVFDSFHGGLMMTLADSVACFTVLTLTDANEVVTTTDMNIRFLAPCLTGVTARAKLIKLGRSLCPTSVDLIDDDGKLVAIAQVSYMRLSQKLEHQKKEGR